MKSYHSILTICLITIISCQNSTDRKPTEGQVESNKVQVLLVGSSHWNNYRQGGFDIAQTNEIDILSEDYQKELESIANKIAKFGPDKIFVERTLAYQPKLDSLFNLYKNTNWGQDKRNEIYQLGFRVASKLNHKQIFGIDYRNTSFPYDSLMSAMTIANQEKLIHKFNLDIEEYENQYNGLVNDKASLIDIFNFLNNKEQRRINLDWYLSGANQAGTIDNNIGSFLASEWIKRNIFSYGLIQKYVEEKDKKIMVLMGAGHIAVLENLINSKSDWKTIELEQLIRE